MHIKIKTRNNHISFFRIFALIGNSHSRKQPTYMLNYILDTNGDIVFTKVFDDLNVNKFKYTQKKLWVAPFLQQTRQLYRINIS